MTYFDGSWVSDAALQFSTLTTDTLSNTFYMLDRHALGK